MNPYIKLLSDETGKVHTIELNYKYFSFNYLLNHLKKMPEFELVKKDKWVLTDDYWVTFIYKEYEFNIESPFVDFLITRSKDCPDQIFNELINHLDNYKPDIIVRLIHKIKDKFKRN